MIILLVKKNDWQFNLFRWIFGEIKNTNNKTQITKHK